MCLSIRLILFVRPSLDVKAESNDSQEWQRLVQRARTMPPFSSVSTAKTVFPSIRRVQALSEDTRECLSGTFPLQLVAIDVNFAVLCASVAVALEARRIDFAIKRDKMVA